MRGKPKVYLAGPITGLTFGNAQSWREYAKDRLSPDIDAFSPLRQKDFLANHGVLDQSYSDSPLSTDRGINTRDHHDCKTSDLILCNLLDAHRVSIGTVMEVAWSFAYRVPLVMVMPESGGVHDHPMVRECIGFRTDCLDHALDITMAILLPN
jgi:nucleoside 2-deoxyribosyltransferase